MKENEKLVTFDLETMPTQDNEQKKRIAKNIKPPAQIKKKESIDNWHKDKAQGAINEKVLKTSFDGGLGGIYCIGLAIENDEPLVIETEDYTSFEAERALLESFNTLMSDFNPYFIGHNIKGFDLKFLRHRFIIHRLKPTFYLPYNTKPWGNECFDTMTAWTGGSNHDYIKLDDLCNYLKVQTPKGAIDGSKVWEYIKAGKGSEVAEYCKKDVQATRECAYILRQFI